MTFASIAMALPLAALLAFATGWVLIMRGTNPSLAALWAFSVALVVGVAALLSDSPAGMLRAVWPREAVDWLAVAAGLLTLVATWQMRPVAIGRITLVLGILLGMLIVCRLMYGSIYLRPGHTSVQNMLYISLAGGVLGLCWHLELARRTDRRILESLACGVVALGASATLGMSGSFQYAMIGVMVALVSASAWAATRSWPWVSNLVILMLLGLGLAFAELSWLSTLALTCAMGMCTIVGLAWRPDATPESGQNTTPSPPRRARVLGLIAVVSLVTLCVGLNAQRFLTAVKGNNASHGGYEAYK